MFYRRNKRRCTMKFHLWLQCCTNTRIKNKKTYSKLSVLETGSTYETYPIIFNLITCYSSYKTKSTLQWPNPKWSVKATRSISSNWGKTEGTSWSLNGCLKDMDKWKIFWKRKEFIISYWRRSCTASRLMSIWIKK